MSGFYGEQGGLASGIVVIRAILWYYQELHMKILGGRLALFILLTIAPLAADAFQFQQNGSLLVMSNGNVAVQYNLTSGQASFLWQGSTIISNFYSGAGLSTGYVKGTNYTSWSYGPASSNEIVVTAIGNGHPTMNQYFTFDQTNSFLMRLEMVGSSLSANWMGPMVVDTTGGVDLGSYGDDRALFVPFDNDHFISYNAMSINGSDTSYEVGAFYDNVSRNGLVVGSVTHDVWKSGVYWSGSNNKLNQMNVFGGAVSANVTWDVMPHGSVTGSSISSPTIFVGFGPDWRRTMESFADENTSMVPKLTWTNGAPFGWNSWGVIQEGIDYEEATNTSAFVKNNLQSNHFNDNGVVYINLDSYWDNLTSAQLLEFVNYCHARGQKAGVYWGPFVWWGSSANAASSTVEGTSYNYSQVLLKTTSGAYETNDGALAMDLTHPGTQQRINYYINEFNTWGFDCLKIDFLSHGALEGVHYDTNVTTGIEAFNEGMRYLFNQINGRMFISESIAPLFPYQYGHSRRIACDSYTSKISNTEYTLNAVSYGWWLDRLYCFNDPDDVVLEGPDANENQSRIINAAITGIFLDGDSFTNSASENLAVADLTNNAINTVARSGQTFVPVDGNTGTGASTVFTSQLNGASYLAVFNYSASSLVTNVDLVRAGISNAVEAVDLWTGRVLPVSGAVLPMTLNEKQARLFCLLAAPTLQSPQMTNGIFSFTLAGAGGYLYRIDETTNFATWNPVATITNSTGSVAVSLTNVQSMTTGYRATLIP
jgi:hypothetical protein